MRKVAVAIAGLAVVGVLAVGLVQASDDDSSSSSPPQALSRAEVSEPLDGAPPDLAALRRRVNELVGGGIKAFDAQLRALKGHPVVVNMWASWCGPCRYELPFFQSQAVERGDEVAFVGVNVGDNRNDAELFAEEFPMPYPSYEDPRQAVRDRYGARGLPATAFYDARGELQFLHQGLFATEDQLSAAIERYAQS